MAREKKKVVIAYTSSGELPIGARGLGFYGDVAEDLETGECECGQCPLSDSSSKIFASP